MRIANMNKNYSRCIVMIIIFSLVLPVVLGNHIITAKSARKQVNEIKLKKPEVSSLQMKVGSKYRLKLSVKPKVAKLSFKSSKI